MRNTTMTVEDLKTLRKYLRKRKLDYDLAIGACEQSILEKPTDMNLQIQSTLIGQYAVQQSHITALDRELRFDLEDLTDEEVPYLAE